MSVRDCTRGANPSAWHRSFLLASHHTVYDLNHLLINTFVCAVNIVAKLPEMHKVRIFGINKTVGLE